MDFFPEAETSYVRKMIRAKEPAATNPVGCDIEERIMEISKIQKELVRLTDLVSGWNERGDIPGIERDLALDKLRTLYEAIRFDGFGDRPAVPSSEEAMERAEPEIMIDLEALSATSLAGADSGADVGLADERETAAETSLSEVGAVQTAVPEEREHIVAAGFSRSDASADVASVSGEQAAEERMAGAEYSDAQDAQERIEEAVRVPETLPETVPAVVAEVVSEAEEAVAVVEDRPVSVETTEGSAGGADVSADSVVTADGDAIAGPEPGEDASDTDVIETTVTAVSADAAAENPTIGSSKESGGVSSSLFDLDDLVVRHREKRRVILSLYETDAPSPKQPGAMQRADSVSAEEHSGDEKIGRSEVASADEIALSAMQKPEVADAELERHEVGRCDECGAAEDTVPADSAAENGSVSETPDLERQTAEVSAADTPAPKAAEHLPGREPVLGEVIGGGPTLADTIPAPKDMASEIVRKERITDLKQAIGINDRFLMIRDLFGGDAGAYDAAIDRLNAFDDLDDCIVYISETYDWMPGSDGARLLVELLERKLS